MSAHPDPKSFDTLEAAQAEIARCYHVIARAASLAGLLQRQVQTLRDQADATLKAAEGQQ